MVFSYFPYLKNGDADAWSEGVNELFYIAAICPRNARNFARIVEKDRLPRVAECETGVHSAWGRK